MSGTIPVVNGGTGTTTSTGTGSVVLSNSPTLVTPSLGTPSAAVLTNATGLPLTTGVTGILPVANGGSGSGTALTQYGVRYAASTTATATTSAGTTGQPLLANTTSGPAFGQLSLTTASAAVTGTLPIANGGTNNAAAYTAGSVIFSNGTSLTQDNSKLFWDDTNFRLGIGTAAPTQALDITGTGQARVGAILGASTTPTIAYGTGAGTGPTTAAFIGTQVGMYIQFTTGTTPAIGTIATITVPNAAPNYVLANFMSANANSALVLTQLYTASTATTFTLNSRVALVGSTTYAFNIFTVNI